MRFVLAMVLAGLAALPLSVSAQADKEGATSEPNLEEPSSEPTPEEPALQLELDATGVEVSPLAASVAAARAHAEMERRVQAARVGVGFSAVTLVLGAVIAGAGAAVAVNRDLGTPPDTSSGHAAVWVGTALVGVGGVSMIATGIVLGKRKRKLRELQRAHYGTPRRVQWDLAQSRLVF